ncbi:hypothetical protein WJX79_010167 [Trebouxia sp. C0005]
MLGSGGYAKVERWYDTESGEWVAAKCVTDFKLAQCETTLLLLAEKSGVPRVVRLKDKLLRLSQQHVMLLELIDGIRLLDYIDRNVVDKHLHLTEARMVATAAPLLETLCKLHDSAGIAHMDVKPENILLTPAEDNAWNRLRLIDFGLSAKSDSGAKDVVPAGSSLPYAAPEVLHALKLATQTKAVLLAEATQTPAEHPILSQRYDVSAAAMGLSQQRVAAAYKAVNEQRPMPAARHQFRAPASKAKKEMPFDPLRRPGGEGHLDKKWSPWTIKPLFQEASESYHAVWQQILPFFQVDSPCACIRPWQQEQQLCSRTQVAAGGDPQGVSCWSL